VAIGDVKVVAGIKVREGAGGMFEPLPEERTRLDREAKQ